MQLKDNPLIPLAFTIFVGLCVLLLEYIHVDFSEISEDHPKPIHLIFDDSTTNREAWTKKANNFSIKNLFRRSDEAEEPQEKKTLQTAVTEGFRSLDAKETITKAAPKQSDSTYFIDLVSAEYASITKGRKKPVIRYYRKARDGAKVDRLRQYGYYIHERKTEGLDGYESNAINYGDSVDFVDLQLIAYTLIAQGLDIKSIAPSRYHADWKSFAIEIGTDTSVVQNPSISLSELRENWPAN